jgi:hypothetical protein
MVPAGFGAGEQHIFEQHKATVASDSMMHNAGVKMAQFTQLFTGSARTATIPEQPLPLHPRGAVPIAPVSQLVRRGSHTSIAATPTESSGPALSLAAFAGSTTAQRSIGRDGSIGRAQSSNLRPGGRATSDAAAPSFSLSDFSQGRDPHAAAVPVSTSADVEIGGGTASGPRSGAGVNSPAKVQVGWNRLVAGFKEVGKGLIE